jgi:GAF domain-containing protein
VLRRELIGVLNVTSHDRRVQYTEEDLQALLVFAESAGICCRHAEQAAWMRDTIRRLDGELTARRSQEHRSAA